MKSFPIGHTENNLPIMAHQFERRKEFFLILGGVHGDEVEGVIASKGLLAKLIKGISSPLGLAIVPVLNEDGFCLKTRQNQNGVDLNRNLPTKDWQKEATEPKYAPGPHPNSEAENLALTDYIRYLKPKGILSLHSWKPLLNVNGPIKGFAQKIAQQTGYEIVEDIGYPTPGSLGTYGLERQIAVLTYEIQRGLSAKEILEKHVPAMIEALKEGL